MEERPIVHGDCHLWGTALLAPPENLWMTHSAYQIRFSELDSGTAGAGWEICGRHAELAALIETPEIFLKAFEIRMSPPSLIATQTVKKPSISDQSPHPGDGVV